MHPAGTHTYMHTYIHTYGSGLTPAFSALFYALKSVTMCESFSRIWLHLGRSQSTFEVWSTASPMKA
jgi:hypothetical protein